MLNVEVRLCLLLRERRVVEEREGAHRERQRRAFLRNNVLRGTHHSSPKVTISTAFTAARAMAPIFEVANKAGPTFCDPKSR
jgi:hypothetical protein